MAAPHLSGSWRLLQGAINQHTGFWGYIAASCFHSWLCCAESVECRRRMKELSGTARRLR